MSSPSPPQPPSPSPSPSPSPEPAANVIQDFVPLPPADGPSSTPPSSGEGLVALYALFPATPAELLAISRACHADLVANGAWGGDNGPTNNIFHPAPQALWSHSSPSSSSSATDDAIDDAAIDAIVAYHRATILPSTSWGGGAFFDRELLAIATTPAWATAGVTLVTVGATWLKEVADDGAAYRRGWDAWTFRAEAVGTVVVNLQLYNMGWTEFTTWMENVQPEGGEADRRGGRRVFVLIEVDEGPKYLTWVVGIVNMEACGYTKLKKPHIK
ncbi:hypothetical protein SLS58_007341 [Diplodia intermedia]|uniref:Uncharacterized protein n=1 Tax=Diplodia intermedia TaxID=856260 RepID=A0ABR3TKT6_9PEZI